MLKVGITGQPGFIGSHLFNHLGLYKEEFARVVFLDSYFESPGEMARFVRACDVIIHLAAVNRHESENELFNMNVALTSKLIDACRATDSRPLVIYASSIQEDQPNTYGRSKKRCRELLESWAESVGSNLTCLKIPNVFGPFGRPFYNSVIATFCHQLTHGDAPRIDVDKELKLIFVDELAAEILRLLRSFVPGGETSGKIQCLEILFTSACTVSHIKKTLEEFHSEYFRFGRIPDLNNAFRRNLFHTFASFIDHRSHFPVYLCEKEDARGKFVEILKTARGGQVSFSLTNPGFVRGNHFHTRKVERFIVIQGSARIDIRKIDSPDILSFELNGDRPAYVDMPIWYTHRIVNIGETELTTIFFVAEYFDKKDPDTYSEGV